MAVLRRPPRVVVGVDGSQAGLAAARWAAAEAAQRNVELRVVQVQSPCSDGVVAAAYGIQLDGGHRGRPAEIVSHAVREVQSVAPGLPVTGEVIFGSVVSSLLAAGRQSQLLVLGSHTILSRALARSWSCVAAVASKAPVPVAVVEPSLDGIHLAPTTRGLVVVLAHATSGIDHLLDYSCAQAERRRATVDVVTVIRPHRRRRESAQTAAEEELFDALRHSRGRWPSVHHAGLVSTVKADAEVRSRLSRADLIVIDGHHARSLMRRSQLAGPLGLRTGPCALTVLPR